jgi:ABC-type uncharacterized transport system auxiliary subunit
MSLKTRLLYREDSPMREINQALAKGLLILLLSALMVSCASIPELKVHYQLPPASEQLGGRAVVLVFEDARDTKEILGQGAKKELKNFSGNISFSVARHGDPGFKIGVFEFPAMMREAFKRRLENAGLTPIPEQLAGTPQLLVTLNDFNLDLVKRKWVVKIGYVAKLIRNGKVLSTQTISGQAERYKIVGTRGADAAFGEIFTDMINRLDVVRLFQQARLIGS